MRISDRWKLDPDTYGWQLTEYYPSHDRDGTPKIGERKTWHLTLEQVATKIINEDAKRAPSMHELKSLLQQAIESVEGFLNAESSHGPRTKRIMKDQNEKPDAVTPVASDVLLAPCPSCGGSDIVYLFACSQGYFMCRDCGACGPEDEEAADPICSIDAASKAWNRRANASVEASQEQL